MKMRGVVSVVIAASVFANSYEAQIAKIMHTVKWLWPVMSSFVNILEVVLASEITIEICRNK